MSRPATDIERMLEGLDIDGQADSDAPDPLAAVVFRKNRENALGFLSTPYSQRVLFVPQCLRSTTLCKARERRGEYLCVRCGACKIAEIGMLADELGYLDMRILKGGSALMHFVKETKARAVLGVACPVEGVMGIIACERAGIPVFCVPLLKAGCADTDVDMDDVRSAMEATVA